jgi:hypothetical protein
MLSPPKSSRTHEVILGLRLNAARNHFNFSSCLASLISFVTLLIGDICALIIHAFNVFPHEVVLNTPLHPVGFHASIVLSQELGLELLGIEHVKNRICLLQTLLSACRLRQCRKQLQSLDSGPKRNARLEQKGEAVFMAPIVVAARGSLEDLLIVSNVSRRLW